MLTSNAFLQLPGQNDSFRRAHSDSSIPHSIAGPVYNTNLVQLQGGMIQQQQQQVYNQHSVAYNPHNQLQFQQQQMYQQQQQSPTSPGSYQNQVYYNNNGQQAAATAFDYSADNSTIPFKHISLQLNHQASTSVSKNNVNSNSSASSSPTSSSASASATTNLHKASQLSGNMPPLKLPINSQQHQQNYMLPKFMKNVSDFLLINYETKMRAISINVFYA
jgi:hypothetical protein